MSARRGKTPLFLLAGAGFLGGPEGDSGAHGLLLDRSGGTAELARNGARGSSRLGGLFQSTQLTGAPGSTVIRGTLCHKSSLQSPIKGILRMIPGRFAPRAPNMVY